MTLVCRVKLLAKTVFLSLAWYLETTRKDCLCGQRLVTAAACFVRKIQKSGRKGWELAATHSLGLP